MAAEPYELGPESPAPPAPPPRGLENKVPADDAAAEKARLEKPFDNDAANAAQGEGETATDVSAADREASADETDESDDISDAAEGKLPAVLAYALCVVHIPALSALAIPFPIPGLPYFAVILLMRQNRFALYHAKQAALLWLLMVIGTVMTCFIATMLIGYILDWGAIALAIVGLVHVAQGAATPLPIVGRLAENLLAGIQFHED
jgi:uncharacterized membrane protein